MDKVIQVSFNGIHDFKKIKSFTQNDRLESFDQVQCSNCRMIGRRVGSREPFVLISNTYSQQRIELCERDNFIDKYLGKEIQIICKIRGGEGYNVATIYSVHTIVKPPVGLINGEQGVWIQGGKKEPIKILFDEYCQYPILPRKGFAKRTQLPIIKSKRTCSPIIKRKRTN